MKFAAVDAGLSIANLKYQRLGEEEKHSLAANFKARLNTKVLSSLLVEDEIQAEE